MIKDRSCSQSAWQTLGGLGGSRTEFEKKSLWNLGKVNFSSCLNYFFCWFCLEMTHFLCLIGVACRSSCKPAEFKPVAVVWYIGRESPQANSISRLTLLFSGARDVNICQAICRGLRVCVCSLNCRNRWTWVFVQSGQKSHPYGRLTENWDIWPFTPHTTIY